VSENDVKRVREELKRLGITNKIPYKSDEDTLAGKYRITGYKNISKYYEGQKMQILAFSDLLEMSLKKKRY